MSERKTRDETVPTSAPTLTGRWKRVSSVDFCLAFLAPRWAPGVQASEQSIGSQGI